MPRGVGWKYPVSAFHPAQLNCPTKVPSWLKMSTFLQNTSEMNILPVFGSMARCVGSCMLPLLQPKPCW